MAAMLSRRGGSLALVLALAATAPVVVGCKDKRRTAGQGEGQAGGDASGDPRPVRVPLVTPVRTLVPAEAQDPASQTVVAHLYERLYELDADGAVVPSLAASMPTFEGARARIPVRADHAFSGPGSACAPRSVTADDVAASLRALLDPAAANHGLIAGRLESGEAGDAISVEHGDGGDTVVLHLAYPQPELAAVLAAIGTSVVPRDCQGLDRVPFGSGPYTLGEATQLPNVAALSPKSSEASPLVFEHVQHAQTALTMFAAGELDVYAPAQDQFGQVFDDRAIRPGVTPEGTRVVRVEVAQTNLLLFTQTADSPRQRAIRSAVCLAFDGERYQSALRNGGAWAKPAHSIVPPTLGPPVSVDGPCAGPRDAAAAAAALAQAGVATPLTLRYATATGTIAKREADLLSAALADVGIELEVSQSDAYLYDLATGESSADLFALGLTADYADPRAMLQAFTCSGDLSPFTHYCNPAYDARLGEMVADGPLDRADVDELEGLLQADRVARPIDHPEVWYLVAPGLDGIVRHPTGPLQLAGASRRPL